jgi:hypothetical protein
MQSEPCFWFLLKLEDEEFAIQYEGPDPETEFAAELEGHLTIAHSDPKADLYSHPIGGDS